MSRERAPRARALRRQAAAILAVALLGGLALRAAVTDARTIFSHDGVISHLAAAGQQMRWEETSASGNTDAPYAHWVRVEQWQTFLRVQPTVRLRTIARDLSVHDVHPPLYFWLLHATCLVLGTHVWVGPLLNTLIDFIAALVIFGAARWWLQDDRWAAVAALVWMISPAALATMREARHYSLLALVTVAFAWQFARIIEARRPVRAMDYAMLAALTGIGVLTHLYFAMVAAAALILAALWRRRATVAYLGASMVAGSGVALVADPWLASFLSRTGANSTSFTLHAFATRVLKVGYHLFDLWGGTDAGNVIGGVALIAGLVVTVIRRPRGTRLRPIATSIFGPQRNPFMALALLIFALIGLTYIAFIVPRHAIGPRYLAPVWPLMAIGFAGVVRPLTARRWLVPALVVFALANSIWLLTDFRREQARQQARTDVLEDYDHLLVDQVGRGAVLPLIHELDADTMVFIAHTEDIVASMDSWEPVLRENAGSTGYASNLFQETSAADRRTILRLLRERGWEMPDEPLPLFPNWVLFPLHR